MHGVLSIASTCVCTLGGTTAVQGSVSVGADAVLSVEDHVVTGKVSKSCCSATACCPSSRVRRSPPTASCAQWGRTPASRARWRWAGARARYNTRSARVRTAGRVRPPCPPQRDVGQPAARGRCKRAVRCISLGPSHSRGRRTTRAASCWAGAARHGAALRGELRLWSAELAQRLWRLVRRA